MISLAWEGDWPVSQLFGVNPANYKPQYPGHEGLDIAIPTGIYVRSLWHATVAEVGLNAGPIWWYGYYVKLHDDNSPQEMIYAHLSPYHLPAPGDVVVPGERVGIVGASGRIRGIHLHLSYRKDRDKRGGPYTGFSDPLPHLT